ncbi:LacI family DNA-binding transcriptional regulator [Rhodocytophaga aerolata]|uniref:LacI family DNA-binding transcriptional regulator n=1 Tax=Rhodocytophaga aerolata TaxID=455078 RepID=A0ABT8R674_9BACT|nr:LacI family DNA-binding transcriptional regulator [Rhodocytophaga aerolata]MDO1447603.1 LacI family DNA-binding transcriptional regulator [Rhodocytophaga aerolata]
MSSGQVTIKDIARQLNISVATVSRALRDFPDINENTKKAVTTLAAELDYRPNQIAQSLVKRRTNTIGVVIPTFVIPFYASAISGIQEEAAKANYNVMVCQSNESYTTEVSNIYTLASSRVDGLLVSVSKETTNFDHLQCLQQKGIEIVFFNRVYEGMPVAKVVVDDYDGAVAATEHLISIGRKRIAHFCGPQNLSISQERRRGYVDALKTHNLPVREELMLSCDFNIASGMDAARQLLQVRPLPDAIFAVSDSVAFGAMKVLKEQGIRIPEDIAIAGYTDEPTASLVDPGLTTVAQPTFEIGQTAARLLFAQINRPSKESVCPKTVLKTRLIIRGSTVKNAV